MEFKRNVKGPRTKAMYSGHSVRLNVIINIIKRKRETKGTLKKVQGIDSKGLRRPKAMDGLKALSVNKYDYNSIEERRERGSVGSIE